MLSNMRFFYLMLINKVLNIHSLTHPIRLFLKTFLKSNIFKEIVLKSETYQKKKTCVEIKPHDLCKHVLMAKNLFFNNQNLSFFFPLKNTNYYKNTR